MKISEVFYILYIHQSRTRRPDRLVVFYRQDNLEPILAYELDYRNCIPKSYRMLEYVNISMSQLIQFKKQFDNMGILQERGRGIPEGEK